VTMALEDSNEEAGELLRRLEYIVALTLVLLAACTSHGEAPSMAVSTSPPRHPFPAQRPSAQLVVPDVRSLSFAEARTALVRAGLGVVPVYLASADVPRGVVLGIQPAPDVVVNGTTFVETTVSAGPEPAGGISWVASVFEHHQRAFIGNYRGPNSEGMVAIGSGSDRARWQKELQAASEGRTFRLVQCDRTASELRTISRKFLGLIETGEIKSRGAGWGVDPRSCSVLLQGSFPASSIEQVHTMFGDAVTIVDGVPPAVRLQG
jgi:hypothetical protein